MFTCLDREKLEKETIDAMTKVNSVDIKEPDITVLVDVDGVLLDMCGAIKQKLAERGITFYPEKVETYNFKGDIGCDRKEVFKALNDVKTFAIQKEYDGVQDALKLLGKYAKIKPYTKVKPRGDLFSYRSYQISKLGLEGRPITSEKKGVIEGNYTAVFDDCIGVLEEWAEVRDIHLFLIDQPYNQDLSGTKLENLENLYRCSSFAEAVCLFTQLRLTDNIEK